MSSLFAFVLRQRIMLAVVTLFVFAAGVVSFMNLNIEAYQTRYRRWLTSLRKTRGKAPRKSSGTLPYRSKFRWPDSQYYRHAARSACRPVGREGAVQLWLHL